MSKSDLVSVAVQQIRPVPQGASLDDLLSELSPTQHDALDALMAGQTREAAADAAGVHRMTLHRWLKTDPFFIAAHNAWKRDARESAKGKLSSLIALAIQNIEKSLETGDPKLAYQLLKDLGCLDKEPDDIPTDPALVKLKLENDVHREVRAADPKTLRQILNEAGLSRRQRLQLLEQALEYTQIRKVAAF